MNDTNRPRVNSADADDLLENLLTGQHQVPPTRPPQMRHTGKMHVPQPPVDVRVHHTGSIPSTRHTGSIPSTRHTGSIPSTRHTGSIPSTRHTGGIDMRVTRNTSKNVTSKQITRPTTPLAYSEENDLYLYESGQQSLVYTAGTNIIWVTLILILVWLGLSIAQHQDTTRTPSVSNFNPVITAFMKPVGIAVNNLISIPSLPQPEPAPRVVPVGESSVLGKPTISAQRIDEILRMYQSPAQGTGQIWIDAGIDYDIDPVYALSFFMHESGLGTNPQWAGIKGDGTTTHNVGNIICAGYATCFGRFRDYPDWETGIRDWYRLIAVEYVEGRGVYTVDAIIPIYAPSNDNNDVPAYIASVKDYVALWQYP